MKLANVGGRASIVTDDGILDVERISRGALGPDPAVLSDLTNHAALRQLLAGMDSSDLAPLDSSRLQAPVPRPSKALGVALNYQDHAAEAGIALPEEPTFFGKFPSSVTGPYGDIVLPEGCDRVDFEAEMVLVVGTELRRVGTEAVWEAIAGITVGQDISDRREQWRKPLNQFTVAKSYDSFSPVGPFLVTVDDLDDPDDLELSGWVDDLEVQHDRTSSMLFTAPELVSWASRRMTLLPGDLIFSGTPAGCGVRRTPRLYLADGMTLRTAMPEVGLMVNVVRSA